ncbi:hypothetical protein ABZT47_26270 [Sphaerisporangium sp. NPDC005289]|uniref:hypothetical protein n=1 Tax=Sphaerisporangium sp. NPDC005289 TaxID=3155247 RepID=UPI0033AE1DF6
MHVARSVALGAVLVAGTITAAPTVQAATSSVPLSSTAAQAFQSTAVQAARGKETAAAAEAMGRAAACLHMYRPEVRPGKIAATVWAPGCRGVLFGTNLMRKRAWGWQTIKYITWRGPGPRTLYANCKRGNKFTYMTEAWVVAANRPVYSPTRRGRC